MSLVFVQKRQKKCYWELYFGLELVASKQTEDLGRGFGIENDNYTELVMTRMLLQVFDRSISFALVSYQLLFVAI